MLQFDLLKDGRLSDSAVERATESLLFADLKTDLVVQLVKNAAIKTYQPHEMIWRYPKQLNLRFVLAGGVVVLAEDENGEVTIDALIAPGQVVGEFEWLGFNSQSQSLETLSSAVILEPKRNDLLALIAENEARFYHNLSKTLVTKLKITNDWLKLRDYKSVEDRLIFLLDRFHMHDEWKPLVKHPNPSVEKHYEIDLIWTMEKLCWCVSSEPRTVIPNLASLVSANVVEVIAIDSSSNKEQLIKAESITEESLDEVNKCFRITVLNHNEMKRHLRT